MPPPGQAGHGREHQINALARAPNDTENLQNVFQIYVRYRPCRSWPALLPRLASDSPGFAQATGLCCPVRPGHAGDQGAQGPGPLPLVGSCGPGAAGHPRAARSAPLPLPAGASRLVCWPSRAGDAQARSRP